MTHTITTAPAIDEATATRLREVPVSQGLEWAKADRYDTDPNDVVAVTAKVGPVAGADMLARVLTSHTRQLADAVSDAECGWGGLAKEGGTDDVTARLETIGMLAEALLASVEDTRRIIDQVS